MKLKEYAKLINDLVPKHGNKEVACSVDDEGNAFHYVYYPQGPMMVEIEGLNKEKCIVCVN